MNHGFTSAFALDLEEYLAFKEAMGFYGHSRIWYLKQFDAYCTRHDLTSFDRATVEGWVTDHLQRSGRYRSWMSYIRDAGRWLATHRIPDAYILSERWKAPFVRSHPYLLTGHEIESFFTAAAHLKAHSPWRWQAVAFFTLMHSCGLRTGEARGLRTDDVASGEGHLIILESKGRRSRRLPLTDDIVAVLADCDRALQAHIGPRQTFFVSSTGAPVSPAAVGVIFNRIWDRARLSRPATGRQPRPYDFRHHFAYANLERWMSDGTDVTAMLPYLARYMGHATFDSTYYYVHTSPDFMDAYPAITRESQSLLPEVGFE